MYVGVSFPDPRYDTEPQGLGMRPLFTIIRNVCWYFNRELYSLFHFLDFASGNEAMSCKCVKCTNCMHTNCSLTMPILGSFSFLCDSLGTRLCAHNWSHSHVLAWQPGNETVLILYTLYLRCTYKSFTELATSIKTWHDLTAPDIHVHISAFGYQNCHRKSVLLWQHKKQTMSIYKIGFPILFAGWMF